MRGSRFRARHVVFLCLDLLPASSSVMHFCRSPLGQSPRLGTVEHVHEEGAERDQFGSERGRERAGLILFPKALNGCISLIFF